MEVSGQLHAPAALPPVKEPLVPIGFSPEDLASINCPVGDRNINFICYCDVNGLHVLDVLV
jgi:hypothetical protein